MSETTSEKNKYVAITIGPIDDALSEVRKPAALWGISYLFSYISRSLCACFIETGLCSAEDIVVPYYPDEESETKEYSSFLERKDGVGLFHDHIIFRAKDGAIDEINKCKETVLKNISGLFGIDNCYLSSFIMISACEFSVENVKNENPIIACGKMLDCMELAKRFPAFEESNLLVDAFVNEKIHLLYKKLGITPDEFAVLKKTSNNDYIVRDIPDIALSSKAPGFKKNKYYCILRADGDNITNVIQSLSSNEQCRKFSRGCLDYCSKVSKKINAFRGVTVYAGGDDLLALVPCECSGKTVIDLIEEIKSLFAESFEEYICSLKDKKENGDSDAKIPSLSFGAFICGEKYPLYEALRESFSLFYYIAKNKEEKNCVVLSVRKNSGQTETVLIPNYHTTGFGGLLSDVIKSKASKKTGDDKNNKTYGIDKTESKTDSELDNRDQIILSSAQKMLLFKTLFNSIKKENVTDTFQNVFDSDFHLQSGSSFLYEKLPEFYSNSFLKFEGTSVSEGEPGDEGTDKNGDYIKRIIDEDSKDRSIVYVVENKIIRDNPSEALAHSLRIMKFFVEKGED